ncbi:MAG: pantoate--beta-alanine ligase [Kiritimatiellae bacterium]|nr:pantoate--beta-alanine ligase [Kiritimatiellia bacterium]
MLTFNDPGKLQAWCRLRRQKGEKIALIPTMGYLHEGHLSLIAAAKRKNATQIVVSVFVNPTQFGPNEDYDKYPRDEKADVTKCRKAGATAMFFPTPRNMYPEDYSVFVNEDRLSATLCGARRPGHFRGVCTVVAKLFNIVHPHFAMFGQKDFQQVQVIRRMVRDLNFDVEIAMAPIVREKSGLALSSRNTYLSDAERTSALAISEALRTLRRKMHKVSKLPAGDVKKQILAHLVKNGLKPDYVEAVDAETLAPSETIRKGVAVMIAAYAGKTRLIDNTII